MYYHDRCKLDFMLFLLNCLMIINMIKLQYYQYPVQFSFSKQEQTSNTILSIMRYSYNLLYTVMSKAANTCNHDGIKIALLSREGVSTLYIGHRCKICLSNLKGLSLIYQNPRHDRNDRISSISQLYAFTAALTVVQESRHFV